MHHNFRFVQVSDFVKLGINGPHDASSNSFIVAYFHQLLPLWYNFLIAVESWWWLPMCKGYYHWFSFEFFFPFFLKGCHPTFLRTFNELAYSVENQISRKYGFYTIRATTVSTLKCECPLLFQNQYDAIRNKCCIGFNERPFQHISGHIRTVPACKRVW